MFGIGMQELMVILFIVVIIFGGKKLPEIGSGIGKAIKNFKQATTEKPDELDSPKEHDSKSGDKT